MFFRIKYSIYICTRIKGIPYETTGEMAERSNAVVLKTIDCNRSGGSNPSFSAKGTHNIVVGFLFSKKNQTCLCFFLENKKDKIFAKNLGFYACSGFLSGTHEVNSSFSATQNLNLLVINILVFFNI